MFLCACLHACCVFVLSFRKLSASGLTLTDVREEVDILDLRAEVKQLKTENDSLTQDNDLLTDDIEHLTKGCIMSLYVHYMMYSTFLSSE